MSPVSIVPATTAREIDFARALFLAYADSQDYDLCFEGFEKEVAGLPGAYAPPAGRLLLARVRGRGGAAADREAGPPETGGWETAGVVGLRPLAPLSDGKAACEMKRLYVRPAFAGRGIGRALAEAAVAGAVEAGYRVMRLDTVPGRMDRAIALYRRMGFVEVPGRGPDPAPGTIRLELDLGPQ